jgi:hypothetical protein
MLYQQYPSLKVTISPSMLLRLCNPTLAENQQRNHPIQQTYKPKETHLSMPVQQQPLVVKRESAAYLL